MMFKRGRVYERGLRPLSPELPSGRWWAVLRYKPVMMRGRLGWEKIIFGWRGVRGEV